MRFLPTLALLVLTAISAHGGDWPGWLGPRRDSSSDEVVKPWQGKLNILWKQPVGEGHSSPVVADGVVYLHTLQKKADEVVTAYDAKTGEQRWQKSYAREAVTFPFGNGPRATPTVANGKLFTMGITGVLTCFDAKTGDVAWQIDTAKKYGAKKLFFGASCSPLVDNDSVAVNLGAKGASVVALDAKTGEEKWKALDDPASYSSGIAHGQGSARQYIFLTGAGLVGLDAGTGRVLWQHPLVDRLAESSTTPVFAGDILFGSSVTFGGLGLRLQGRDKVEQLWKKGELNCYFATPVAVGKDHLYMVTGTQPPALKTVATLRCVEAATGRELWKREPVGTYHASLLRTGDAKLLLLEEPGNLVLMNPSPQGYEELARSKICGQTWAHPALAQGRLYLRDSKELLCVELVP